MISTVTVDSEILSHAVCQKKFGRINIHSFKIVLHKQNMKLATTPGGYYKLSSEKLPVQIMVKFY